eukprot:1150497-Pelagomonas_calceolata.AAC.11
MSPLHYNVNISEQKVLMRVWRITGSTRLQNLAVRSLVRVRPHLGIKQGCLLSPLKCARGCHRQWFSASHARACTQMTYQAACVWKGLVIYEAESEIVHLNSKGDNVPVLTLGGARLACADPFRYLGMLLTKQRNPQATAEYMCAPFLAGCRRIRQLASEHHLTDRPHTMLWLTKAYALPASMYACQIWGNRIMKEGAEMDCPLQTCAY